MRRGIALTVSLLLLVTSLLPILYASTDLYYNRSQIIRANVEKNLAISEIEILKRILITDMLGALDLALSKGTVFKMNEKPEDIIGSILSSWISSISISSRSFIHSITIRNFPGIVMGKLVFNRGGYPISLFISISLKSRDDVIFVENRDTLSVRHSARIEKVIDMVRNYREKAIEMARKARNRNETLSYTFIRSVDHFRVYLRVEGGPHTFYYYVEVRDFVRASIFDFNLNYGFKIGGTI